MSPLVVDIISWLGLALCIGAFFIKDILMLRLTTLIGCTLMTVYYFSISVPQGTISNVIIGLVNVVYIFKMNRAADKATEEQQQLSSAT